jgi:phosphohistidine phosphatase
MEHCLMEIYLIQHAQAKSIEQDPTRPLSEEGLSNIESVAGHVAGLRLAVDHIYHSGKLRAQQTAEILARHVGAADKVEVKRGLDPSDSVLPTKDWLDQLSSKGTRSIAIVGHLPFLDKLTSLLVAGIEDAHVVAFQNAGIVKLVPKSAGSGYSIQWIITPDIQ